MQTLIIGGRQYAIGVEWSEFDDKKAAKDALKGVPHNRVLNMTTTMGHLVQGCVQTDTKGTLHAAAIIVSQTYQTAILIHDLGNGKLWICGADDNQPIFDQVVAEAESSEAVQKLESFLEKPVYCGNHREAIVSVDELLGAVPSAYLQPAAFSSSMAISKNALIGIGITVAAAVIVGLAVMAYDFYQGRQAEHDAQMAAQAESRRLIEKKATYDELVANQERTLLAGPKPYRLYQLWRDCITSLPLSREGWSPSTADCASNACNVEWTRHPSALPSAVNKLPGQLISAEQDKATTRFELSRPDEYGQNTGPLDLQSYLIDLVAIVPSYKANKAVTDVLATLPPELADMPPVVIGKTGTYEVGAGDLLMMSHVVEKLNYPGVRLGSLKVAGLQSYGSSLMVSLEGSYVIPAP